MRGVEERAARQSDGEVREVEEKGGGRAVTKTINGELGMMPV